MQLQPNFAPRCTFLIITSLHYTSCMEYCVLLLLYSIVTFLCQISFLCPNLGSSQHSRHNSSAINCDWVYSKWAPNWLNFPMQFSKTSLVGALQCIGATICIVSPQTGERKVHFPISAFSPCGYFAVIMYAFINAPWVVCSIYRQILFVELQSLQMIQLQQH